MLKSSKCCILGSVLLALGVILLIVGIAMPFIITSGLKSAIPDAAALTEDNKDSWVETPGKYDIEIIYATQIYNCTNVEEVIYEGARPNFTELGPYNYRDYQLMANRRYQKQQVPWVTQQYEKNVVVTDYQEWLELQSSEDPYVDEPMNLPNPAAIGVWFAANNPDPWSLQLLTLYSATIDGLGNSLIR